MKTTKQIIEEVIENIDYTTSRRRDMISKVRKALNIQKKEFLKEMKEGIVGLDLDRTLKMIGDTEEKLDNKIKRWIIKELKQKLEGSQKT